jgi:hypothetical protein
VSLVGRGLLKGLDDLTVLRCLWDFGYDINCVDGWWTAVKKRDHSLFFEANSAEKLHIKIRDDYFHRDDYRYYFHRKPSLPGGAERKPRGGSDPSGGS